MKPTSARSHVYEAWQARDLIVQIASRDIRLRYRQTRLGPVWLVVGPLVSAVVFTLVFNRIGKIGTASSTPYFVYALVGLTTWNLFAQLSARAASCFVASASLVTRVRFPRLCLPFATTLAGGADAAVGLTIATIASVATVASPRQVLGVVGAVLILGCVALLAGAFGLLVALLAVRRRDVAQALPIVLQLGLFATPIAYPPGAVPQRFQLLLDLNPMATLITVMRACLLSEPMPQASQALVGCAVMVGLLLLVLQLFRRLEPTMADVL